MSAGELIMRVRSLLCFSRCDVLCGDRSVSDCVNLFCVGNAKVEVKVCLNVCTYTGGHVLPGLTAM